MQLPVTATFGSISYNVVEHEDMVLFSETTPLSPGSQAKIMFTRCDGCWFFEMVGRVKLPTAHITGAIKLVEDFYGKCYSRFDNKL